MSKNTPKSVTLDCPLRGTTKEKKDGADTIVPVDFVEKKLYSERVHFTITNLFIDGVRSRSVEIDMMTGDEVPAERFLEHAPDIDPSFRHIIEGNYPHQGQLLKMKLRSVKDGKVVLNDMRARSFVLDYAKCEGKRRFGVTVPYFRLVDTLSRAGKTDSHKGRAFYQGVQLKDSVERGVQVKKANALVFGTVPTPSAIDTKEGCAIFDNVGATGYVALLGRGFISRVKIILDYLEGEVGEMLDKNFGRIDRSHNERGVDFGRMSRRKVRDLAKAERGEEADEDESEDEADEAATPEASAAPAA